MCIIVDNNKLNVFLADPAEGQDLFRRTQCRAADQLGMCVLMADVIDAAIAGNVKRPGFGDPG